MTIAKSTRDAAIGMYASGLTAEQVAERVGVSESSVIAFVKAAGIVPHKRIPDEKCAAIISLYDQGVLVDAIAATLGVHAATIRRVADRAGRAKRKARATKAVRAKALELYSQGLGIHRIAEALGMSDTPVYFWLRRAGVLRTREEAREVTVSRHPLQWGAINAERAWVLGLIFGDGGITKGCGHLTLTMDARDEDVLRKVQAILGINGVIRQREGCKRIDVTSSKFTEHLESAFGLNSEKCANMVWPILDVSFVRHFVRGLLDSDGSWHALSGHRAHLMRFTYTSISFQFVHSLNSTIESLVDVCPRTVRIQKPRKCHIGERIVNTGASANLDFSHFDAVAIGRWLYAGETEHMRCDRKYEFWRERSDVHIKPHWILRHERHKAKLRATPVP